MANPTDDLPLLDGAMNKSADKSTTRHSQSHRTRSASHTDNKKAESELITESKSKSKSESSQHNFLDSLNAQQRLAVCHEDGGLLVLAGAGTGKTRVLSYRCAWLVRERKCMPHEILAVTFTNKAAKEMRERIANIVPHSTRTLSIGTFHGMCNRMLRRHAEVAGWDKNFQILDSQDQKNFIRRLLESKNIDEKELSASECRYYINNAKEKGLRARDMLPDNAFARIRADFYADYESACLRENKMDFAELLLATCEMLRAHEDIRRHYAERFRYILIDEMQDTNPLQFRWLKLLDSSSNHYFAVGDDDQSIYAFRGADPDNMRKIQSDLRATKIVRLEENYRSSGNILQAANELISVNRNRLGKKLFTNGGGGALLQALRHYSDLEESAGVAQNIRSQIKQGTNADNIAVLYRTNAQSRLIEKSLIENQIPYRIYGGTRFFDRLEIKHALAYLRLVVSNDNDSLLRVINTPPRGIGAKTIESLTLAGGGSIFAGMLQSSHPKVMAFRAMLEKWRAMYASDAGAESINNSLPTLSRAVVQESGLIAHYESRIEERERADNLREFVSAAEQFEKEEEEDDTLSAFLSTAALESGEADGSTTGASVNLMTVHAAKGLEFSVVYVTGLEEGMFPSGHSLDSGSLSEIEEERRLMYVAITRAKEELFLSFADSRMLFGQVKRNPPSRFIDELPQALMQITESAMASAESDFADVDSDFTDKYKKYNNRDKFNKAKKQRGEIEPPRAHRDIDKGNRPEFRPGVSVKHPKYGEGIILRREGRGDDLKVEVTFKRVGRKIFVLSASPLRLV